MDNPGRHRDQLLWWDVHARLHNLVEQVMATCAPTLECAIGTPIVVDDQDPHEPSEIFHVDPSALLDQIEYL